MSMKTARSGSRALTLLVLVLALVLAACGSSDKGDGGTATTAGSGGNNVKVDAPGVTDTEIRFAAFGTNSNNPLGTCVLDCYVDGVNAYFAWRNSEGGIYGRKLKLTKTLDDQLGQNQQKALEILSANDTFASFAAGQLATGWVEFAKKNVPLYVWNIWPNEFQQPNIFGDAGAICITCSNRAIGEVVTLSGAKKVASLGYGISDNSKQCALSNAKMINDFSADLGGAKTVYTNENLDFGLANGVGPEVTAMKKAGVDLVVQCIDLNGAKTVKQEMVRQGLNVPMYHANTYDQDFVKAAGNLFVGDYIGVGFRPFESNAGGSNLATFKEWMQKTGSKITEISMRGWIGADEAYTGLKLAGENFDRAKVIEASNSGKMDRYTAGGLVAPIDWSRQHKAPTPEDRYTNGNRPDCFALVQVQKDDSFKVVGGSADKPWVCFDPQKTGWAEPMPMNFK